MIQKKLIRTKSDLSILTLVLISATLAFSSGAFAQVITVNAAGGADHTTIAAAFAAIAADGAEVRVAGGVYQEGTIGGTGLVIPNFDNLVISGGWNSTFTARDTTANETQIDGQNTYRCMTVDGGGRDTSAQEYLVEGFTFINGHATNLEGPQSEDGGGFVANGGGPIGTLRNCIFRNCVADADGGAIDTGGSNPGTILRVEQCLITNCSAGDDGGAIRQGSSGSAIAVSNSIIAFCTNDGAVDNIGTVERRGLSPHINNTYVGNSCGGMGTLTENTDNNDRVFRGTGQSILVANCIFVNNVVGDASSDSEVPPGDPGAVIVGVRECFPRPHNNLFFGNTQQNGSPAVTGYGTRSVENGPDMGSDPANFGWIMPDDPGKIEGLDPLLVDPAGGDFSLQAGSPAIDSGTDLSSYVDILDRPMVTPGTTYDVATLVTITGDLSVDHDDSAGTRPLDIGFDIGAFEVSAGPPPDVTGVSQWLLYD